MDLNEDIVRIKELLNLVTESKEHSGWEEQDKHLQKTFKFKDFKQAMDFVNKISDIAEEQNHHPDIDIKYNKVHLKITDHEKGGISEKCHKFVNAVDNIESNESVKSEELQEKCWPGYTQKGMKTMFGKRYPNCVKKSKK